jgi:hypothetical protein
VSIISRRTRDTEISRNAFKSSVRAFVHTELVRTLREGKRARKIHKYEE